MAKKQTTNKEHSIAKQSERRDSEKNWKLEAKYKSIAHCDYPKVSIFMGFSIGMEPPLLHDSLQTSEKHHVLRIFHNEQPVLPTLPHEPWFVASSPTQSCVFFLWFFLNF